MLKNRLEKRQTTPLKFNSDPSENDLTRRQTLKSTFKENCG